MKFKPFDVEPLLSVVAVASKNTSSGEVPEERVTLAFRFSVPAPAGHAPPVALIVIVVGPVIVADCARHIAVANSPNKNTHSFFMNYPSR